MKKANQKRQSGQNSIIGKSSCNEIKKGKLVSVTLSITNLCQSRCRTCNIWKSGKKDLSTEEWIKAIRSIGKGSVFFTITGGEPFLRDDLPDIIEAVAIHAKPKFINIATNGIATDKIIRTTRIISSICSKNRIKLALNISIDEINDRYDYIRGTREGFRNIIKTIEELKMIKNDLGFDIGTNITVSGYNIDRFFEIYSFIEEEIRPDTIISEVATNRKLFYLTDDVKPVDERKYIGVLDFLIRKSLRKMISINPRTMLVNYLRFRYYNLIRDNIKSGKKICCLAGNRTVEITCRGDVVSCCTAAYNMGNILKHDDIYELLNSDVSRKIREKIRNEKCFCTLSNTNYTNILYKNLK